MTGEEKEKWKERWYLGVDEIADGAAVRGDDALEVELVGCRETGVADAHAHIGQPLLSIFSRAASSLRLPQHSLGSPGSEYK